MATGTELFIAVQGRVAIDEALASVGLAYDWDGEGDGEGDYAPADAYERIAAGLRAAHAAACADVGIELLHPRDVTVRVRDSPTGAKPAVRDPLLRKLPANDPLYTYARCPDGVVREMTRWTLELSYDPDEMGEREDDAILGVSLISRYFPVFLDWMKEYGGSGDAIVLSPEVLAQVETARRHIAPVLPFLAQAPIIIKELHY